MEFAPRSLSATECPQCGSLFQSAGEIFCCKACEAIHKLYSSPDKGLEASSFDKKLQKYHALSSVQNDSMTLYVEGLHCSSCVHLLEKLPQFDNEILEATVNFPESTVQITKSQQGSWQKIAAIIDELGYTPSLLNSSNELSQKQSLENRASLRRIGVSGACAGNMMLFVVPVYSGLAGTWAHVFNWFSFFLFLPVLLYSAQPFYQGAWNSLKYRVINADLPIVVAMLSGFALSTYHLLQGEGAVYFDSTASFLFLILSSRYLLKRVQQKYTAGHYLAKHTLLDLKLQAGQVVSLLQGEKIPADGVLLSPQAEVDLSLFSGESLPQHFRQGMQLFAGTTLLSPEAQMRVEKIGDATRLGSLLQKLQGDSVRKTPFTLWADKLAQILILTVMAIAGVFFIGYSWVDPQQALERTLALIVIACPCALAFGTPLAYGLSMRKAHQKGILIKSPEVFEKLLKIKNIFFDKTGTLTQGYLTLVATEGALSEEEQKIILALESQSLHPVAFGFRRAWKHLYGLPHIGQLQEKLGRGVSGTYKNKTHSLVTSTKIFSGDHLAIDYVVNSQFKARFLFQDQVRPDSKEVLAKLSSYRLQVLSGDQERVTERVASICGLGRGQYFSRLSPEQKLQVIQNTPHSCMIGDGANDALAMKAADVGIAVKGSVDLSLHSADVYFTRGGLYSLLVLLEISQKAHYCVRRNLWISLIYNSVGGVCALTGLINPMIAAILMPISSVLIIFSSLRGVR